MINILRSAALAAAALATFAAAAPADAARNLRPGPVQVDAQSGYVLARIGPTRNARGKTPRLYLLRFDPERGELRTSRRRDPGRVPRGEDATVVLGERPFMRAGETGLFIASLTPGEYVIHGTDSTCFCLGTYAFTVRPGEITDIGTVTIGPENGRSRSEALRQHRLADDIVGRAYAVNDVMLVRPAAEGDPLPRELAGKTVRRAELVADVRFPNRGPVRPLYPAGLLIARAASLPAPVSGDGAAMVERIRAANDEQVALVPREVQQRREAERRRREQEERERLAAGGGSRGRSSSGRR